MTTSCWSDLDDVEDKLNSSGYSIGDPGPSGVGVVFYISDDGKHGLEAAPEDQNNGNAFYWSNVDGVNDEVGTSRDIGSGFANSEAVINQDGHNNSAALICRNYRKDEEGDWYLPSYGELEELYKNKDIVGNLTKEEYYSSSEDHVGGYVGYITFTGQYSGSGYFCSKGSSHYIRAIRSF